MTIAMQIVCIRMLADFDRLRAAWGEVHAADVQAHIFNTWAWMRGWLQATTDPWFVLAARGTASSSPIAFLPLTLGTRWARGVIRLRELRLAGSPQADLTGLLCVPGCEEEVFARFAHYLQRQVAWDRFWLQDVMDPRLDGFLHHFRGGRYEVEEKPGTVCPYVPLQGPWDTFARQAMGRSTRKDVNSFFRRVTAPNEWRMVTATPDNFGTQFDALLRMVRTRWGEGYGLGIHRLVPIFEQCLREDLLWFHVAWDGSRPVAADLGFLDPRRGSFASFTGAFNGEYARLSPGKGMCAYAMRWAVDHGYRVFDFLRGNEGHKFLFGARERLNRALLIRRNTLGLQTARWVQRLGARLRRPARARAW